MTGPARLLLLLALVATACADRPQDPASPAAQEARHVVRFRDRLIDLEPFLMGFPYSAFHFDLETGHLLYLDKTETGTRLRHLPLEAGVKVDLSRGRRLGDVDWSTRTYRAGRVHPPTNRFFIISDEKNDEVTNVYSIDLGTGVLEQVTRNDYTYGWGFSEDYRYLGYLARTGKTEPFTTALVVRDMKTGREREVLSDGGATDRFTWSAVKFTPDNTRVIVTVQHDGNRNTTTLAMVDLAAATPRFEFLVPPRVTRYGTGLVKGWVGDEVFLFISAEEGFGNIYRYDLTTRTATRLTDFRDDLRSVHLIDPRAAAAVLSRPHESELVLLDLEKGQVVDRRRFDAAVAIPEAHGSFLVVTRSSLETPFTAEFVSIAESGPLSIGDPLPLAQVPDELRRRISRLDAERVSYETFDGRALHAYYLEPKDRPPEAADRLVMVLAFYGGGNHFSVGNQILAATGIAVMSPSPRGSSGFGAEFAALNDGDLGGDEIVDILYAARWLVSEKGYEPHQIGVFGGSHGGYAAMRCLTFPPGTNGRDAFFDFGFGWSHAGFSDIVSFHAACNIPDWVLREAGDPATEREKLEERSPYYHVDRLEAPLLLTHGENDSRVPVTESRKFARRAEEMGRPVTYREFPGQGHGIRGFANQVAFYQAVFSFLESLPSRTGSEWSYTNSPRLALLGAGR
jgi:dipeptidyl aminopeptidase/acylaminoacyl peptidase